MFEFINNLSTEEKIKYTAIALPIITAIGFLYVKIWKNMYKKGMELQEFVLEHQKENNIWFANSLPKDTVDGDKFKEKEFELIFVPTNAEKTKYKKYTQAELLNDNQLKLLVLNNIKHCKILPKTKQK